MRFIVIYLGALLFISCGKNIPENSATTEPMNLQDSLREKLNIQLKNFTEIDSSGILMFPLQMGENKNQRSELFYKEMPFNGFWNILFYNSKTGGYHLLTENKVLIMDYDYKYNRDESVQNSQNTDYIVYKVRAMDYNNDKLLNFDDPVYLFISDKVGENFRQISPDNYSLNNWKYISSSRKIVMSVTKDSNRNLEFDEKDEVTAFEWKIDASENPVEIFDENTKDQLRILFDRDWKRLQ